MNPGATISAGRVDPPFRRDHGLGLAEDDRQPAVADPDRAREPGRAAAIDDRPVLDEEIEPAQSSAPIVAISRSNEARSARRSSSPSHVASIPSIAIAHMSSKV